MSEFSLPATFKAGPAAVVTQQGNANDELAAGIQSSFGIVSYRGKVWSIKYQGQEHPLMREDGDGARASIECVIIRSATAISKIFYADGYQPGDTSPPDCWSTNGVVPDAAASSKQSNTCAGCPQNAWGSKISEAGKAMKACADSKRLAIVPLDDIANELFGGPMLLRVPAASLRDLKSFADLLSANGYPYYAIGTRISFDVNEAFPKFVFSAIRPLTESEAAAIIELREDPRVQRILELEIEHVVHEPEAAGVQFEQGAAQAPAAAPAKKTPQELMAEAQAKAAAKPAAAKPAPAAKPAAAKPAPAAKSKPAAAKPAPAAKAEEPEDEVETLRRRLAELEAAKASTTAAAAAEAGDPGDGAEDEGEQVDEAGGTGNDEFDELLDNLVS